MLRRVTIGLTLLLLVLSSNAQRIYSSQNLKQLSSDELFLYQRKSLELKKKGEILTFAGTGVGLLGIVMGTVATDSNSSDGDLNAVTVTAATMLVGGGVASTIGLTMYFTGYSRVNRINRIQYAESLRLEIVPCGFYCKHTQNYQRGITLRLRF